MPIDKWENLSLSLIYDVRSQLQNHIYRRSSEAHAAGGRARDEIDTKPKLEQRRSLMRAKLLHSMGGLPSGDTALNARRTSVVQCDGFTIENVVFEARKGTPITASLYLPMGMKSPRGAVIHALGHSPEARFKAGYQTVCQYLVHAGLIVLTFDPIGQGERFSYYDPLTKEAVVAPGSIDHEQAGVQCWPLGQGATRYFIHDVMRAIDYVCTRPEVDPERIGMTGVSGGGMQTLLAMLCEERIAAAAPACYTTSREAKMYSGKGQDAEQIWRGMSSSGFDHEDFLLAFAPKPLLVLAGIGDFFPIEGTRQTVSRARRYWEWFEKGDNLELYEEDCGHMYSTSMAKAAAAFFAKHLLDKEVSVETLDAAPIDLLDAAKLRCTQSGQVRGDDSDVRAIYEENCDYLDELERKLALIPDTERQQRAQQWLLQTVKSTSRRIGDGQLNPRYHLSGLVNGEDLHAQSIVWRSQEDLFNHAIVFRDKARLESSELPVTIAVWEGGTNRLQPHLDWIRTICMSGRMAMVLDLTGVGPLGPCMMPEAAARIVRKLTMDLFWINDSLAAIRIFDVLRALDMAQTLRGASPDDIDVYAHGRYSIYVQCAAILDERARHAQIKEGFGPVADWVRSRYYHSVDIRSMVLPGMLQYFDIM